MKKGFLVGQSLSQKSERTQEKAQDSDADSDDEMLVNAELKAQLRRNRKRFREFVKKNPLPSLDSLKDVLLHGYGSERVKPIYRTAKMPDERVYPMMKAIYDTAATDKKVMRQAGEEINKIGGFNLMQVSIHSAGLDLLLYDKAWQS